MGFLDKYFSKPVFRNAFVCFLAHLFIGIVQSFFLEERYQNDLANIALVVSGFIQFLLQVAMIWFFYRDFEKKHRKINLNEIAVIGLINYFLLCVSRFFPLWKYSEFKFSSYFIDTFLELLLSQLIFSLIIFVVLVNIIGMWKIYQKAGEKGWASIVPFYNIIVMLKIVDKPSWWLIMLLIPFVNVVFAIMINYELSKRFGKYDYFVFGLILLPFIFFPILGFGDDEYGFE